MEENEYKKAYSVYNQVFGTPQGIQVLADLKQNFYDPISIRLAGDEAKLNLELTAGARFVINSIFDKMKCADKRKFADTMREIELIEPIGKET